MNDHQLHPDPAVDDMLRAANARAEAAEAELADVMQQQPFRVAEANRLRAEAAERRLAEQQAAIRQHFGYTPPFLSDPTALDALIARERADALWEAADAIEGGDERCAVRRTCHLADAITLRSRADALTAEAEQ